MVGRMIDILSRKLQLPLWKVMENNFLCEGKKNSLGQTIRKSHGNLFQCLHEVKNAVFDIEKPKEDENYIYGRGLAAMMKSPKMAANSSSGCQLKMGADGSVFINLAGIEM